MSEPNSLIASKEEEPTEWYSGVGLFDTVADLSEAISSGSWIDAGLGMVGLAAEAASLAVDPLGTLASYGVGWLIDHVQPLQDALNYVAGDPEQIAAYAKTWENVSAKIAETAQTHKTAVEQDVSDWTGATATAYKTRSAETSDALNAAVQAASAASQAIEMAGMVVSAVRDTVKDLVAQAVGRLAAWAAEALFTLGTAAPLIAAQAAVYVAKTVATITKLFTRLAKTMAKLRPLLAKLKDAFTAIAKKLRGKNGKSTDLTTGSKKNKNKSGDDSKDDSTKPAGTEPSSTDKTKPASTEPTKTDNPKSDTPEPSKGETPKTDDSPTSPASTKKPKSNEGASDEAKNNDPKNTQTKVDLTKCNDPVDAASGEFLLEATDVDLPGVLPLVLERLHRSGYRYGRWFGPTWAATLDMRIIVEQSSVTFIGEDGILLGYPHSAPGTAVLPMEAAHQWPLSRTESGGYQIYNPEREIMWHFALSGDTTGALSGDYPISAITDRHHNRVQFRYDQGGNPTEITHSGGYRISVQSTEGRITALSALGSDSNGNEFVTRIREFEYEHGELIAVTNGVGATTTFGYDDAHRMLWWKDSNGNSLLNVYDEPGRVIQQRGNSGVVNANLDYVVYPDGSGRRTVSTDSLGATTTYIFDADLRCREIIDALGNRTYTDYDKNRRPIKVVTADGATTTYNYNSDGDLSAIVRPDGADIRIEYHTRGRPSTVIEAGVVYRHEYDDEGNHTAFIDAAGARTEYTYHHTGAVATITRADGAVTSVEVDPAGLPITVTDPLRNRTTVDRDHFGRPILVTEPTGAATRYEWTSESKLLRRTDADGNSEVWSYDGEGNLTLYADANHGITRYHYGAFDLLQQRSDPTGAVTGYEWDTEQRLTSVTNPIGLSWHFAYDRAGRLTSETDYTGATTTYTHDRVGRISTVTAATGVTRQHSYDILGRLTKISAATGEWLSYTHNLSGRLLTAVSGHAANPIRTLEFTYNSSEQLLTQELDGQHVSTFEYDRLGRRLARTSPSGSETRWQHNPSDQITTMVTDGRSVDFTYNAAGQLTTWAVDSLMIERTLTPAGHLANQKVLAHPIAARPDTKAAKPQSMRNDEYTFRADGYPTAHTVRRGDSEPVHRTYGLDSIGRVTTITENGVLAEQYAYDQLDNITGRYSTRHQEEADHAAARIAQQRRRPFTASRRRYHNNLLIQDGHNRYHYDSCGRLIRKTTIRLSRKADVWHYRYNAFDQLTDVYTPTGAWWQYTYDALGRRSSKRRLTEDGSAAVEQTDFTWDGTCLTEQCVMGTVTRWTYQPDTYTPITQSIEQSAVDREFHAIVADLVGTPLELVDPATCRTEATAETDLWGITTWNGTSATPLRFPGQVYDAETGFHYNFYRVYDPATGRYLTQDPLGLLPSPNPNTYPHNPGVRLDPLGLTPCSPGTRDDADLARQRAEELNSLRRGFHNTTAVFGVYNWKTGEYRTIVGINGEGEMPRNWNLNSNESFVNGPGHAEENILKSLGPHDTVVYGAASTNFCYKTCLPLIEGLNVELGVARGTSKPELYSPFTMFWTR
ncbi:DUF6531 domain-containing protein [Nocardia sp. NPDC050712]|uniref:DUF6531 domain-containing protein n=1 Tax=Nocardia sp. NPDC050712 TaxID=3155518 RepID=UPI0033E90DC3